VSCKTRSQVINDWGLQEYSLWCYRDNVCQLLIKKIYKWKKQSIAVIGPNPIQSMDGFNPCPTLCMHAWTVVLSWPYPLNKEFVVFVILSYEQAVLSDFHAKRMKRVVKLQSIIRSIRFFTWNCTFWKILINLCVAL